jgi:hypothetical protein
MDVVLVVGFFLTLLVFEPGNEKINAYCKQAVIDKEFESRKLCWDYYHEYREDIPDIK